ncbi:Casanova [Mortierella alpina]|uniref:Casanova n=1 Tax=Mortierella alpina TaxID=64518 RepID=A0A9P6ISF9_MORAP|nr:Casanova [Mortierella alpina]
MSSGSFGFESLQCTGSASYNSAATPASRNVGSSSKHKKIPRPPNSFLIYRKEHAARYAGLVATELSTKLAQAWKKETPERRNHYAMLAEKAKQDHAVKYPNYKFTPMKRGTGKRALALKAMANAAKKAASMDALKSPVSPNLPLSTLMDRPRRNSQRPQRFSSSMPSYSYATVSSGAGDSRRACSSSASPISSSLFFHPYAIRRPAGSPTPSTSSSLSSVENDHSDSSDIDAEGEEVSEHCTDEMDDGTQQISKKLQQLLNGQETNDSYAHLSNLQADSSSGYESLPTPPYQEDPLTLFECSTYPYPPLLSMESFEPECLARDDAQWTSMAGLGFTPVSSPSSISSHGYLTPSYEGSSQPLNLSMDMTATTSVSSSMSSAAVLCPMDTTAFAYGTAGSFQYMILNEDLPLSPAPSPCSTSALLSPQVLHSASMRSEVDGYFANVAEWL